MISFNKEKLLQYISLFMAVCMLLLCIYGSVINFTAIPIFDTWSNVIFYARIAEGDYAAWWEHHNEHLIFLTRLLFWLDFRCFHGSVIFLIVSNYGLILGTCLVLSVYLKERLANPQYIVFQTTLLSLMVTLLFSWVQRDNIIWTFQSQFFLATFLPLLAFLFLHKASAARQGDYYFAMACVIGVLALGSMANGVMVLPLLTLLAILLRFSYWRIGSLLILAVVGNYLYFLNYQVPIMRVSLLDAMLQHPLELAHYLLLYLGSPLYFLTGEVSIHSAEFAGISLIGCAIYLAYRELNASKRDSLVLALLVFILYVGGTALGTGGGRLAFGVTQALTSRYTTPVLQVWAALLVLFAPGIVVCMRQYALRSSGVVLGIQLLMLTQQTSALSSHPQQFFDYKVAMLAAVMQVKDQQLMHGVFAAPEPLIQLAQNPTISRLAFLSTPALQEVKSWQHQVDTVRSAGTCLGSVDGAMQLQYDVGYLGIRGWLFNREKSTAPESVRILNQQRKVIGYALVGMQREDLKKIIANEAEFSGFQGYVSIHQVGQEIILKGMGADCEISVSLSNTVPAFNVASIDFSGQEQKYPAHQYQACNSEDAQTNDVVFNVDGTLFDKQMGLQWMLCDEGLQGGSCQLRNEEKFTYQQAMEYVKQVNDRHGFSGKQVWRLPSMQELIALGSKKCVLDETGRVFPYAPIAQYWSGSLVNFYGYYAWDVLFLQSYDRWLAEYYRRELLLVRTIV